MLISIILSIYFVKSGIAKYLHDEKASTKETYCIKWPYNVQNLCSLLLLGLRLLFSNTASFVEECIELLILHITRRSFGVSSCSNVITFLKHFTTISCIQM